MSERFGENVRISADKSHQNAYNKTNYMHWMKEKPT
jgi:hypothetical protein